MSVRVIFLTAGDDSIQKSWETCPNQSCYILLQVSLGDSLRLMPAEQFQAHKLPAKYVADDLDSSETTTFPENLVFILNHLVPMLSCDRGSYLERRSVSTTAYKLLSHVMDKVVECQESSHEKEGSLQIAAAYKARAKVVDKEVVREDNDGEEDDGDIEEMCELPRRITDQVQGWDVFLVFQTSVNNSNGYHYLKMTQ